MGPRGGATDGRQRRRALRAVGAAGIAVALLGAAVGLWNPGNLVYASLPVIHPVLAVAFVGGVGVLWFASVDPGWLRASGLATLLLVLVTYGVAARVVSDLTDAAWQERAASPYNDVEVELLGTYNTWTVWLRADRGLLSRRNRVAEIGVGDSVPPPVEVRVSAPDELVVLDSDGGEVVYRARFDPGDLGVREEECRPISLDRRRVGCV